MKSASSYYVASFALLYCHACLACPPLVVTEAWIREPPPSARVAAGYFTIDNHSNNAITITNVQSECCEAVEMHRSIIVDDKASMSSTHQLSIAPQSSVKFAPGDQHLMLIHPSVALRRDTSVNINFQCSGGTKQLTEFKVVVTRL